MIISEKYGKIILVLIILMSTFWLFPSLAMADDHERRRRDFGQYEMKEVRDDKREWKKDDKGHEVTGQLSLWSLVAANLNVALSIFFKGANRYIPLGPEIKGLIKRFSQIHKKNLMRFHYVLNPFALCIAGIHFLLSSCRSSQLPEWGLICLTAMVFLGFTIKFRLAPKRVQRVFYRLHTGVESISVMTVLLVIGHVIVD